VEGVDDGAGGEEEERLEEGVVARWNMAASGPPQPTAMTM